MIIGRDITRFEMIACVAFLIVLVCILLARLIIENVLQVILFGRYVKISEGGVFEILDIPGFPLIYIGGTDGIRFRP